jgi:hypothetical protein
MARKIREGDRLLMSLKVVYLPEDEGLVTVEVGGQRVTLRRDDRDIRSVEQDGRERLRD